VVVEALAGARVVALACGWRHTLAVTARGEVYAWGRGVNGARAVLCATARRVELAC
jgi:alpha-tubulin suppressor-like RCC1 family protein